MPEFDTYDEAVDWMEAKVNDHCTNNYRFAYVDEAQTMSDYEQTRGRGCCGEFDSFVIIRKRLAMIGCNYGH